MSHLAQREFCRMVRRKFSRLFWGANVIDVGSLDINGNNKYLFRRSSYLGIDIVKGKNVDIVGTAKDILTRIADPDNYHYRGVYIDVVISTEMLEHDAMWADSLHAMYQVLKPGGLLLVTCAGIGRREHGTTDANPKDSPGTNDYYKNVSNEMFASVIKADMFTEYYLRQYKTDLQFYGIKK